MSNTDIKDSLLRELTLNCYKGNHIFKINPENIEKMDWDFQERFLAATFNNKLMKQYPVSSQFSKLFLKKVLDHLEPIHEVHDDIYAHLCTAMKDSHIDGFCYRHYVIGKDLSKIVTMKETRKMVVNGTTGLKTWEAALMLSDWALCNKDIFSNKNVIELGSGVGFVGITIGKMCDIKSMLLTDCHDEVLTTIEENIKINFSHFKSKKDDDFTLYSNEAMSIGVMKLDWNEIEDLGMNMIPDIIIGADIVYDPTILVPLCKVLHAICNRNNKLVIYIASVIRNEETFKNFLATLDSMNFKLDKLELRKSIFIDWNENMHKCILRIQLGSQVVVNLL